MLKLKDKNKKLIAGLINYKDLCIESTLSTGDKKLSFSLPKEDKFYNFIEEECYIETKTQEYVIKARDVGVDYTRFDCVLNLETLEANIFDRFESVEQTITNSLNLAIVGTGWTVKDNTLKKKRTVRCTNKNALEIVQEIKKTYRVDIVFNTLEKQIEIYEHLGEDKGTYFIDSLNLTALQVQSDSYKFATRIIAEGKDKLTFADINNGKNYVENYQYSNKVKTIYWKDERYTIKESLLEDARAKLEEISKPFVSYNASILNLAELNPKYKNILDYKLGDTITLISRNDKVKDKQRIVKTIEYPQDHSRDTVELANATLKFEDIQQENQETTDTVSNITVDNGTVDGSTIDSITTKQIEDFKANVLQVTNLHALNADIDYLKVNKADMQDVNIVKAKIGTLETTKANITELNSVKANLEQAIISKASITDLNAVNGKIGILESKTASIDNLLAGNLTANNFKANSIVAGSGIIADGAIGDAQISSLSGNKLRFGTIDTSLVTVAGPNGRLKILGNKLQIFDDVNNRLFERIMLGINDKNRACLTLRATDGQTVLLTEEGLTKAGITDGFGKADDNSLSALKLDKNSIVRQVNGATETIAGTRIQVGDRTLDVELSTQKNTITEHSKELSTQKASIQALDNAIKLKVDSQVYRDSINTINNNISITNSNLSKATTELNLLKGEVSSKVNKTDIDKTVKEIEDKIKVTSDKISTAESSFTQKTNEIKANVSNLESETITKIINAKNEAIKESRSIHDTRNDNQPPSWYIEHYPRQTITEFKNANVLGITGTTFGTLETKVPWGDSSGGYPIQTFRSSYTSTFQRRGLNSTTWSVWEQIEDVHGSQSKANEALNNAKAFVNAEITAVNSKVHNVESNLSILTDRIASKVSQSDIDKSIQKINIGGRNLVLESNKFNVGSGASGITSKINSNGYLEVTTNSNNDNWFTYWAKTYDNIENNFNENDAFTISFTVKAIGTKILPTVSLKNGMGYYQLKGNLSEDFSTIYYSGIWKKENDIRIHIGFEGISGTFIFKNWKIEKGNKPTDWTPAPEDLDKAITDNIQVVDSKISDVSSTVTQLKNSVTTKINSINSKTTTLNGKIVNAETRLNSVEAKITDTSIINTVRREFYSKGETDNMYSSKSEVTQLSNSLEWKISTLGAGNLIKNSSFNGGFDCWIKNGNPSLSTNTDFLQDRYGKMISIEGGAREGIFQRFPTIPGEMYTVSFFAESDRQRQLETLIGIEGVNYITLKNKPGFRRWDFTFKATSTQHTFVAYLDQAGKFYLGRVMVTQGSILQEYREGQGIYSNIARFDVNGFTIESSSSNTRTITDSRGFRVQDISSGENLLEANARGVSAKGGRFYVDGHDGNYTLLWGRDITINGQRALVGTHSHPEPSLQPNKLIVNYNNDFANGVEIGGKLTNNTFPILSALGLVLDANGYIELNNGLIIQYGSVTGIPIKNGNIVDTPVRYRKRFPHACISFLASIDTVDKNNYLASNFNSVSHTNGQEAGWFYAKNLTNDKFGALMDINYIAIGY